MDTSGFAPTSLSDANDATAHEPDVEPNDAPTGSDTPKRLRIRIPIARNVARRPIDESNDSPQRRRFVVTRVRALGPLTRADEEAAVKDAPAGHRITITRRRKIQPTGTVSEEKTRPRITRKKLVKVRPLEQLPTPTPLSPTLAIITTGFYGSEVASSIDEDGSDYTVQEYDDDKSYDEEAAVATPTLEVERETIEHQPTETESGVGEAVTVVQSSVRETTTPVILTDHFFLPPSYEDAEEEEEYEDEEAEEDEEEGNQTTRATLTDDVQTTTTGDQATYSIEDEQVLPVTAEATISTIAPLEDENSHEPSTDSTIVTTTDDVKHLLESSTESVSNAEQGTAVTGLLEKDDILTSLLDDAKNVPDKSENATEETITPSLVVDTVTSAPTTPTSPDLLGANPLAAENIAPSNEPRLETVQPNDTSTSAITDRPRTAHPVTFAVDLAPAPVTVHSDELSSDPFPSHASSSAIATNHVPHPSSTTTSAPIYDDVPTSSVTPTESFRYYETVVTSTRLRTYTYVVTKLNGLETEVTSSTEVRPKVTTLTLTLTVPVAAAASTRYVSPLSDSTSLPGSELLPSPTQISTSMPLATNDGDDGAVKTDADNDNDDEQGRRFNLATRIMSNGVGVIVAASAGSSSLIAPRWENPSPSIARPPTLTLSDAMVMLMPRDTEPREFVTKTCTTTFAYLGTYVDDAGVTRVSTRQEIVYNTATEERHGTGGSVAFGITLEASPTLGTEVFETTYTYFDVSGAEGRDPETRNRSTVIVTNTVTAPQRYLDVILEPSETPRPETNAYPSTRTLERTFTDEAGRITIRPVNDVVTRLVVTESARAPRPVSSIEASSNDPAHTDIETTPDVHEENVEGDVISRTYFVTYSYYRTLVEDGSTVVHTNVATSSDVVTEKVPAKRIGSTKPASIVTEAPPSHASPEPIQIFATKTYLTTYTYFTTLLQADTNGETSTTVSSRSRVVENVVTESIAPSLLEANDYASALLRTVARPTPTHVDESSAATNNGQQFEGINNVVTGSTIIFFDEEDQIDSTATAESTTPLATETLSTTPATENREPAVVEEHAETHSTTSPSTAAIAQASASQENDNATSVGGNVGGGSFGSLGPFSIHGLSALGPVITAMAGLLQGKTTSATRRNDTITSDVNSIFDNLTTHRHRDHSDSYEDDNSATRRSPVYIPVAEFADASDIETAESQNIGNRLAANLNRNYIPESRHKVTAASLANGIPISPGEVITANSDVIIGKPGRLGPRPPQRDYATDIEHVEMLPPPIGSASFDASLYQHSLQRATVEQQQKHQQHDNDVEAAQIQIVPARQVFEEHLRFTSASADRESSAPSQSGAPRPAVFRPPAPRPAARPPTYAQQQQQQQQISSDHSSSQSRLEMESNRRATAAALPDDPLLKPPGLTINALPAPLNDQKSTHGSPEQSIVTLPDPKEPNWSPEKYRRPWSAKDPLETPDAPPVRSETVTAHGTPEITWVDRRHQKHEHPAPWAQKDPLLPEATIPIVDGGTGSRPHAAVAGNSNGVRHVVPHVIDRPTGQPLLVNIQPSQVANVVIPQGGNQALIFGDTNEPHITGQYFDDPSPYPDPEVAAGFTIGGSLKKTEDPTEYMVPPLSSHPINYQQPAEVPAVGGVRPPDFPGRTEILVRPAASAPPPPRRSEVGGPPPRRYVVLGKRPPMPTNDVPGWKRKPEKKTTVPIHRPSMVNIRRQPPPSPTRPFPVPNSHEIHGGAGGRPGPYGGRKPSYVISPSRGSNVAKTPDAILTPPYRTQFVSRVPTTIDGQMHVDQFHPRPEVSTSFQQQIFTGNVTPGYGYHMQSNAHHSNYRNRSDIPITESTLRITKQENVPTGAVEYHDPSTDPEVRPVDASYYPRLPTVRPEVQSFGQILPHPEDEDENRVRDKWTAATQTERTGMENDSELGESQDTIHRIKEVPVVDGLQFHTPVHDASNPNVNDGPDEGPIIVRGKPFGVYAEDGQTNGDVTGQHSPTLEIDDILVQGVPFGYHGNDPIAPTRLGQETKDSTSLIVYHPYPHQQHVPNRQEESRPESQGFAEPTPTLIYAAQPTAPSSSGILVLNTPSQDIAGPNLTQITPPSPTSYGNGEPQADVYYDEVSTSELNVSGSTYHPMRGDIEINHRDDDEDDGIEFSLAVDATGEETNSDAQTERPPSMFSVPTTTSVDAPMQREPLDNPVSRTDRPVATNIRTKVGVIVSAENNTAVKSTRPRPRPPVPHRDMMPPPLSPTISGKREDVSGTLGLEPPPLFPDLVVGLSPPPLAPVTPPNNSPAPSPLPPPLPPHSSTSLSPPKYIPLADSTHHAASRPFLMEILSQDMVPPALTHETLRPMPELSTIRPSVAVSGNIHLATVETTSQFSISPIVSKSRIPVIHGTPSAIVDATQVQPSPSISVFSPQFTRTKHLEGVDGYVTNGTVIAVPVDVRPATSRPPIRHATTAYPTKLLRPTYATTLRPHPVDQGEPNRSSTVSDDIRPSRPSATLPTTTTTTEHHKVMDRSSTTTRPERIGSSVLLQPSQHNNAPSHTNVPTEALSKDGTVAARTIISMTTGSMSTPTATTLNKAEEPLTTVARAGQQHVSVTSATLRPSFIDSAFQDYASTQKMRGEETSEHRHDATQSVVRLSIAMKEKPGEEEDESTTRTHLLTHTLISTTIETVTETLPRITSSTKVSTAPPLTVASTMRPLGTTDQNGDSIFVVMSDHQPPNINAEKVEAEYGSDEDEDLDNDLGKRREGSESPDNDDDDDDEEDRDEEATRDEQDPIGSNEIHRVLAGGILGAPAFPREPTVVGRCLPDCRASKAEVCTEINSEMRCTCRPGFARMFPDRPCKHEYKRLAESTRDALDRTMMQSDLRDVYRGLKIAGFQADTTSTGVDFHAQFSNNADEAKLEEVVRKYLVGNNYSLGGTEVYAAKDLDLVNARDFDECSATEGGPYHDCSPHAACFNLRGSYQCSCSEGWADLSDNLPAYPGRVCSQAPLGCTACNNKGHCAINSNGQEVCECFPWHTGQRCQVNLKVLLIALVTTGIVLLGLLGACVGFACFGGSRRRGSRFAASRSGDRRAMIAGSNDGCGDTSSEGSAADLAAIPHHVPHVLPAPPKTAAPAPPTTKRHAAVTKRNESSDIVPVAGGGGTGDEQRDRSLTVMIPRAKYRSVPQSPQLPAEITRVNEKSAESSNLVVDERKLLGYLEGGSRLADDRRANVANKRRESSSRVETNAEARQVGRSVPTSGSGSTPSGALVSAGFQVSATVMNRFVDAESTLARSCGETTVEPSTRIARSDPIDFPLFTESCVDATTTITNISPACITRTPTTTTMTETTTTANQPATKLLRLQMSDLGDVGSTLARSCGETTIQPPTRMSSGNKMRRSSSREPRDNASDGHTMAERDVGGTLRMPAQRPPFYDPDSRSSDRESNFDSL